MNKYIENVQDFPLDHDTISRSVRKTSPGVYVLDKNEKGNFYACYVGRSDNDIRQRLKQWVGSKYHRFAFGYFRLAKYAFERECILWHDFTPPDNKEHPKRPDKTNWKCLRCNYGA